MKKWILCTAAVWALLGAAAADARPPVPPQGPSAPVLPPSRSYLDSLIRTGNFLDRPTPLRPSDRETLIGDRQKMPPAPPQEQNSPFPGQKEITF